MKITNNSGINNNIKRDGSYSLLFSIRKLWRFEISCEWSLFLRNKRCPPISAEIKLMSPYQLRCSYVVIITHAERGLLHLIEVTWSHMDDIIISLQTSVILISVLLFEQVVSKWCPIVSPLVSSFGDQNPSRAFKSVWA